MRARESRRIMVGESPREHESHFDSLAQLCLECFLSVSVEVQLIVHCSHMRFSLRHPSPQIFETQDAFSLSRLSISQLSLQNRTGIFGQENLIFYVDLLAK